MILIKAMRETGMGLDEWLIRASQPLAGAGSDKIVRDGNPDGALFGEIAVFTGALSMPRREAADLAAEAGCEVDAGVTKTTNRLYDEMKASGELVESANGAMSFKH